MIILCYLIHWQHFYQGSFLSQVPSGHASAQIPHPTLHQTPVVLHGLKVHVARLQGLLLLSTTGLPHPWHCQGTPCSVPMWVTPVLSTPVLTTTTQTSVVVWLPWTSPCPLNWVQVVLTIAASLPKSWSHTPTNQEEKVLTDTGDSGDCQMWS